MKLCIGDPLNPWFSAKLSRLNHFQFRQQVLISYTHDWGGGSLRPLSAAAPPKKSEAAVSVVPTPNGDGWRLPLMATPPEKPPGRTTHLPGSLGAEGGPDDLRLWNWVISSLWWSERFCCPKRPCRRVAPVGALSTINDQGKTVRRSSIRLGVNRVGDDRPLRFHRVPSNSGTAVVALCTL